MRHRFLALVVSFLAANPAAALAPATALPRYADTAPEGRGRGVAVYANGDVLLVGQANCCSNPVLVRLDPTMGTVKWRVPLAGYAGMQIYCVAISGDTAMVGGSDIGGTVGRLVTVNGSGVFIGAYSDFAVSAGYRGLAVDPVDGSFWAVGPVSGAPSKARILNVDRNGDSPRSTVDYFAGVNDAYPRAIAVTADRVYVGGYGYDISIGTNRPWIMARPRSGSAVKLWEKFNANLSAAWVTGLAAVGDDIYSFLSQEAPASFQQSFLSKHDPATGAFGSPTTLLSNAPMTGSGEYAGGVVRHPSLPLVIASTANGFKVFKPDLTEVSGAAGTFLSSGTFTPSWLAVSGSLEFTVVGALSNYESAFWRFNGVGVRMSSPFAAITTESKLLVAPNRLDLARPGAKIRFVVKVETVPAEGTIRMYDLAGHPVAELAFTASSGSTADVLWDGRREDGTRVGPGTYLAVVDGDGFDPKVDRGLFIITGGAK